MEELCKEIANYFIVIIYCTGPLSGIRGPEVSLAWNDVRNYGTFKNLLIKSLLGTYQVGRCLNYWDYHISIKFYEKCGRLNK